MLTAPQPSQVRYTVDPRDVPPIKAARRHHQPRDPARQGSCWTGGAVMAEPDFTCAICQCNVEMRWSMGQNRLPPSADRWSKRSETYAGIAAAFADQWGRPTNDLFGRAA